MKQLCLILLCAIAWPSYATDRYVATTGSDTTGNGSIGNPYATIAKAVSMMSSGDTCWLRGGTYHEEVVLSSKNNLSFRAYNDEQVTMDGTVEITTPWSVHSGSIYKTTLPQDVWQLFADGEMAMPARCPNASLTDESVWDQDNNWAKLSGADLNNLTTMIDTPTGHSDLAGLGFSVVDAMAVLNIGSFRTYTHKVLTHTSGTTTFTVDPVFKRKSSGNQFYFLEGMLEFLDVQNEWYFNDTTKELYYWGDTNATIRGKVQDYAFNLTNCDGITISGIDFFATTVRFKNCDRAWVEKGDYNFPSCTKRMLGAEQVAPAATEFDGGTDNTFFDNTMRYADTEAIYMNGADNRIENCLFEYIDWSCGDLPGLMGAVYMYGSSPTYRGNTGHTTGGSAFFLINAIPNAKMNRIEHFGLVQNDGSAIQMTVNNQTGSETAYNWFFNNDKYGARFDASTTPGSPTGSDGLMHHNVGMNVKSTIMQKGDYHECFNNTSMDCINNGIIILKDDVSDAIGTVVRNNAVEKLASGRSGNVALAAATIHDHNWNGYENGNADMRTLLRDPDNFDFRPIPNSVLVDAGTNITGITDGYVGSAPDIGAYEHGAANYWIAGRKESGASTAIPPNGSTSAKASASLMWQPGLEAVSNNVYFGSSSNAVATATTASPEFRGSQLNNVYDPLGLQAQTYWWRIDTHTATGTVKGVVWNFSVPSASPAAPGIINSTPSVNVTNFSATVGGRITDGGTGSRVWIHVWPDGGATNVVDMGIHSGAFETNITGIAINTQYNMRCFATNNYGSSWAPTTENFVIGLLPEAPVVVNTPATNILTTSATLGGSITNDTLADDVWIYYWPDGGSSNVVALGTQLDDFSTNLTGLADNTLYHFQCFAGNSYGSNWAATVESFTTLAIGSTNWVELTFDDFESGWGSYTNGGANAVIYTGGSPYALGNNAAHVNYNGTSASFWLASGIDIDTPRYPAIKVEFSLYFKAMDNLDYLYVDFWDGTLWKQVERYNKQDYGNNTRHAIALLIPETTNAFTASMNIRFRGGANNTLDLTYIDNVRISAIEPLTTLYDEWLTEFDLAETNLLADSDFDGMDNLTEYALGGNPINDDAVAILPDSELNGEWLEYVYRRRTDAETRGLIYRVEAGTNLVSGSWTTNAVQETGTGALGSDFEFVTNRLDSSFNAEGFIRLRILKN